MKTSTIFTDNNLYILATVLLLVALFGWQDQLLLRGEEPRRAIVSLEMLLTGEYIVPHIDGWTYYNKPPLFNWIMAGAYQIFGTSNWVVRLPGLLGLLSTSVFLYYFVKRYLDKRTALLAAFMAFTCGDLLFFASVFSGEIDMFYAFLTVVQVAAMFHYYRKGNWLLLFLVSYFFASLGFLTKALPSILFQGFSLIALAITFKNWKFLFKWQHIAGLGLFCILIGSYLWAFEMKDDALGFLMRQTKEAAEKSAIEASALRLIGQFIEFPFQFLKILLPWSLLIFLIFSKSVRSAMHKQKLIMFSLLFILLNIPIYWISNYFKARYLYMFLPFACIIFAYMLHLERSKLTEMIRLVFKILIFAAPLIVGFGIFAVYEMMNDPIGYGIHFNVNLFWLKAIFVLLGVFLCCFLVYRTNNAILASLVLLAFIRIGWNFFYFPIHYGKSDFDEFLEQVDKVVDITGDDQIFMYGGAYVFDSEVKIGSFELSKELRTAPQLQFRIPFYITAAKKKILQFEEELHPGRYYIMLDSSKEAQDRTHLAKFFDNFNDRNWVLIRTEDQ